VYHHYLGAPPALFSDAFRRETEKGLSLVGPSSIHNALTLALPSGTVKWGAGISSAARGLFEARVVKDGWGPLQFGVSLESSDFGSVGLDVLIFDHDQTFKREIAAYGRTIRGSTATVYRLSPGVPDADAFLRFSGQLDSYEEPSPLYFLLHLRPNDLPIRGDAGVALPRVMITEADWPAAHADAIGKFLGPVYGIHNSNGGGGEGFIPTLHVDTVNHRYAWSLLAGKSVTAAYEDGVQLSTALYTPSYITRNGKLFSVVTFTSARTGVITLDVEGITDNPAGTGTLITNRVKILQHICANQLWNNVTSGAYAADSSTPLGLASMATLAQFLDDAADEGAFRLDHDSQTKGDAVIRGFLESLGPPFKAWWNNLGQLDFGFIDHRPGLVYQSEQVFLEEDMTGGPPALSFSVDNIMREVVQQYVYDHSAKQLRQTITASDLSVTEKVSVSRTNPWSASRIASAA
jgi:hypothetical protein